MSASKERLYFLIQRAAHVLKKRADAKLKEAGGITTAQGAVITILLKNGPCKQGELASLLMQRESAITTMADRLIKAGYVERYRSEDDGRAWVLQATKEGRRAHDAMRKYFEEINTALDTAFPPKDATRVAEGLKRVLALLNET